MPKPACLVVLSPDHTPFVYGSEKWPAPHRHTFPSSDQARVVIDAGHVL